MKSPKERAWDRAYHRQMRRENPEKIRAQGRRAQRVYMERRRTAWIEANGPCRYCGSSEDLEVDHVDPATKVSSKFWHWSAERRSMELAKCQVLCRVCHAKKTAQEWRTLRTNPIPHGTDSGYSLHRYRGELPACAACVAAHSIATR